MVVAKSLDKNDKCHPERQRRVSTTAKRLFGRGEHAPSHRPDVLRESDTNWTLLQP